LLRLVTLFAVASLAALAVQTTLPCWIPVQALIPNLIVILAVDLGLQHHGALATVVAFMMGYATDAVSGTQLGLNALLITAVYLLAYEVSRRLMVTTRLIGALTVFLATLFTSLAGLAITSGGAAFFQAGSVVPGFFLRAVVSAMVAPIVFSALGALKRMIELSATVTRA